MVKKSDLNAKMANFFSKLTYREEIKPTSQGPDPTKPPLTAESGYNAHTAIDKKSDAYGPSGIHSVAETSGAMTSLSKAGLSPHTTHAEMQPTQTGYFSESSPSDLELLTVNLKLAGLDQSTIDEIVDVSFGTIQTALDDTDILFLIDNSGSTAGARRASIVQATKSIGAVGQTFDKDGIQINFISEDPVEPARNLSTPESIVETFAKVTPKGATPMARSFLEIIDTYLAELLENQKQPAAEQRVIKSLTVIAIIDGVPSADYLLKAGLAAADGVTIDGVPTPEHALVAGRLPDVSRDPGARLVDIKIYDENWMRHDGIPVSKNATEGKVLIAQCDRSGERVLVQQDTRQGPVLVRIPLTLEEVFVHGARVFKEHGFPAQQFGICNFQIGNEEGVEEEFSRLANLPKLPAYQKEGLRNIISFVKPRKDGFLTATDILYGVASARNQRLAKASAKARIATGANQQ